MDWLNYHHLLYFWEVARKGSIKEACEELHVTQPTISSQLQALEESLGQQLFIRRRVVFFSRKPVVWFFAMRMKFSRWVVR